MNITSSAHGVCNIINENFNWVNNINEQGFSIFKKVESFSKSYMVSCVSKAFLISFPLYYVGLFSFSTVFPIFLALIVATSLINLAKDNIKAAMNALAKKSMHYLRQLSEVITHIFHKICAFMKSFTLVTVNLIKERSFSANSNKNLQINHVIVSNHEAFKEEPKTSILSKYEQACASSQFKSSIIGPNFYHALNLNTETAPEMPEIQTFAFKKHNFDRKKETLLPFSPPPGQINPAAALLKTISNSKNPLLNLAKCPARGNPKVKIPLQVAGIALKACLQNIAKN